MGDIMRPVPFEELLTRIFDEYQSQRSIFGIPEQQFYSPQAQCAFVGDVLFAGSIGRTDFPQGNHQDLIDSIKQRLWPMGDATVFVPGHGPQSTFGQERKSNPFVRDN